MQAPREASWRPHVRMSRHRGLPGPAHHHRSGSCRTNRTSCQRCNSGNPLKAGIPVRVFPLEIFQKSEPSACACTRRVVRLGPRLVPEPSLAWHDWQRARNSLAPPAAVSGRAFSGFTRRSAVIGAVHVGQIRGSCAAAIVTTAAQMHPADSAARISGAPQGIRTRHQLSEGTGRWCRSRRRRTRP